ncbi:hypothetical protein TPHA_0O01160 [Tetrapisispora phaffii CBS 4417]|uniref:GATA-type domain-containing protein n=1 Tax=Tetrapisispora phaffii (strain ATCC 24235 / CBS 4417 / NBRC 1672 / NRRL Y-8282 / UCD 70-5) TaxID=1071381 RepID=G8C1Q7_TETPH|nr:hypothetical protein TPHA_0O01160 [Tetrapisispora phaffii CBS 4417]CCE66085.1 hypothetical protein TPHA_0O01160 [Tetrapisispora phaffii CBS 4417]
MNIDQLTNPEPLPTSNLKLDDTTSIEYNKVKLKELELTAVQALVLLDGFKISKAKLRTLAEFPLKQNVCNGILPYPNKNTNTNYARIRINETTSLNVSTASTKVQKSPRVSKKKGIPSKSNKNRNYNGGCVHCGVTETVEWRKGPQGNHTLCNSCGLFYRRLLGFTSYDETIMIFKERYKNNPTDRRIPVHIRRKSKNVRFQN